MNRCRPLLILALSGPLSPALAANTPPNPATQQTIAHPRVILKVDPATCQYENGPCVLTATVTDEKGAPLSGVPVSFWLNGKKFVDAVPTSAGGLAKAYGNLWNADHLLNISVHGGANSLLARVESAAAPSGGLPMQLQPSGAATLTITPKQPTVFLMETKQTPLPPVDQADGNALKVRIAIPWAPLKGKAEVTVGPYTQTVSPENTEILTFPLKASDLGKVYPLTIKYLGDDLALPATLNKSVAIEKPLPAAWGYSVQGVGTLSPTVRVGETIGIKVHIHADDAKQTPVAGTPFKIVGHNYIDPTLNIGSGVTDSQGNAVIQYTHTKLGLAPTTYPLVVQYDNMGHGYVSDVKPGPSDARGKLIVAATEIDVQFVELPIAAAPGDTVTVRMRLTRRTDHAPAAKIQIRLFGDTGGDIQPAPGSSSVARTDDQGIVSFTFKLTGESQLSKQDFHVQGWEDTKTMWFSLHNRFSIALRPNSRLGR